jgi:hypothetical protein
MLDAVYAVYTILIDLRHAAENGPAVFPTSAEEPAATV